MSADSDQLLELFIAQIERDYSGRYDAQLRKDVAAFLRRRVAMDEKTLPVVMSAIKERAALRFGPPDVATIREAIQTREDETSSSLRPRANGADYIPILPDVQEVIEASSVIKARAQGLGIDTTREGWLMKLVMVEAREKVAAR